MAAIENGAMRVEGAVNGIGERAGNTALEEVALGLYVRKDHYGIETNLKLDETKATSDLVAALLVFVFLVIKRSSDKMRSVMNLEFIKMVSLNTLKLMKL